jgi:hypothetical protein
VPERDPRRLGDQHSGGQALLQRVGGRAGERLEEPELGSRRYDGDRFLQRSCGRAEPGGPGEHRVPDRVRDPLRLGGQRLDDEERVAGGLAVELVGVDTIRLGELGDRPRGEPGGLQPPDPPAPRQLSEQDPQGMRAVELVVAIADDHQRRHRLHPAGEQPQDVERRLVRPVHVLEHEHGRDPRAQLARQRHHHRVRHRTTLNDRLQLAPGGLGNLDQRPERARREERVASAPEDPRRPAALLAEPPQEDRLADPGLAADQQHLPTRAALDCFQAIDERRKLGGTFEQDARCARAGT